MDARCPVTLAEWFRTNGSCVGFTVINGSCVGKFETIPKDLLGELVINHTKFRKSVCRPKKDERVYKQDSRLMVTTLTLAIVEDSVVVLVGSRIAQKAIDATGGIPNHVLACRFAPFTVYVLRVISSHSDPDVVYKPRTAHVMV